MKAPISFCLALLLFPLCHAQCNLNVPDSVLFSTLKLAAHIRAGADQSKFALQDLTYLCFVRSSQNNTLFDQVRVSILYTYDTETDKSAHFTFACYNGTFGPYGHFGPYPHVSVNMTREGCQDCSDESASTYPTLCRLADPCDAAPCANGGTCRRTGLTDFSCSCVGNWGGLTCDNSNGAILSSGAIIGIALGCVVAAAIFAVLVGVAIFIVFIVARPRNNVGTDMNYMQLKGTMPKQSG